MTNNEKLAELLFPNINIFPADIEKKYPPRSLKEGARVSRFAPSPTGFLHFGNLFSCMIAYKTVKMTNGVFFVRVEDTDQKRKVENAVETMLSGLKTYGINPDEGVTSDGCEIGEYGPYTQSQRVEIYQTYAKNLVRQGFAYPCFCSAEELEKTRQKQENEDIKGYYGNYAKCRDLSYERINENINTGKSWTLRLKSTGNTEKRICFNDLIRGKIEMPENVLDVVLLKTDGIPTYHFAHAVDDHLMHTTHVIRGDEWIASVPLHIQIFCMLGFKPAKYAHIAPIMKSEGDGKRKLSKRKDPEAAVSYYMEEGFPAKAVNEYMMTIANSNFEDWRKANQTASIDDFPFNLKKMSVSGALFDTAKLTDVSKNVICKMSAEDVYEQALAWAKIYDPKLTELFEKDPQFTIAMLNIDRQNKKPRKDIAKWSELSDYFSYMFDETFKPCYTLSGNADSAYAADVLRTYINVVDTKDDKDTWFSKMKDMCRGLDSTANVKEYKQNPDAYRGHVGDISTVIRVALTGRTNTPDLCSITQLLGKERVNARLTAALNYYEEEM